MAGRIGLKFRFMNVIMQLEVTRFQMLRAVELFTGAGGLALGAHLSGFRTDLFVEKDKWACDTLRDNSLNGLLEGLNHQIFEGDIKGCNWDALTDEIDEVAGGPPCQPFSLGGNHRGSSDKRDMFPEMIRAVSQLSLRSFVVENVKGLTRSTFANYYQHILLRLKYPNVDVSSSNGLFEALTNLQEHDLSFKESLSEQEYNVLPTLVNSADYGVPQKREGIYRGDLEKDLGVEWSFPQRTHSLIALLYDQYISKLYWERHNLPIPKTPDHIKTKLHKIISEYEANPLKPWQTVRDAIQGLGEPSKSVSEKSGHIFFKVVPKFIKDTLAAPLDMPAKTLKAGVHGVPGGENMLVNNDGTVRYFSIREAARIQTFPLIAIKRMAHGQR